MKKLVSFILIFLLFFLIYIIARDKKEFLFEKEVFKFGEVTADKRRRVVSFKADILKNEGDVLFLIYLHGYKWLKENSAVVSDAKLLDLQKALAFIDWELWEEIRDSQKTKRTSAVKIVMKQGKIQSTAEEFLKNEESDIYNIIFPGSPYFDAIVLYGPESNLCGTCPLYPVEKEVIMKKMKNPKGVSLSEKIKAFDKNKPVTVHIYVPE